MEDLRINTRLRPKQDTAQHDEGQGHLSPPEDDAALVLKVEASWQEQAIHLPAYTPSSAAEQLAHDSPPTTPLDDPIHFLTSMRSKKHFGFSSRHSIASTIFPWQKHKPVVSVCSAHHHHPLHPHQYAPQRPPLSKESSLARLKVLPATHAEPIQHLEDEELDLVHLKGDQLAKRTLQLLHRMNVQDWADVTDHHSLDLYRISGAMTNCVFLVTGPPGIIPVPVAAMSTDTTSTTECLDKDSNAPSLNTQPRKVLLRVYGVGLESLISRDVELKWLENLSTMEIGPSLLGIFKNGRFEEYVESTTLTKEDIRHPRTSRHIAHRMCELHNIVNVFPPPEGTLPQSDANIAKWIPLARQAIETICKQNPEKKALMDTFDFERLLVEVEQVHKELAAVHSPMVFAHNDTQYGNILKTKDESGELVVIDFEYAGYNTRAFDIANHFCEWTADYHSDRPSVLYPERYPTKAEQLNFLEAYMEAEIAMSGYHLTTLDLNKHSTAIHGRKRRSLTSAIASGWSKATLSAIHATSAVSAVLKKRGLMDLTEQQQGTQYRRGEEQEEEKKAAPAEIGIGNASENMDLETTFAATDSTGLEQVLSDHSTGSNHNSNTTHDSPPSSASPTFPSASHKGNSALDNDRSLPSSSRRREGGGDGSGGVTKAEILDSMYREVNKFALSSHVMWGLWGLIQATQSKIDFDYFEYSIQRLTEFRRRRNEFMAL
ncbi:hypothetical protein EDD11_009014 [Mortierella claussenii]|nr:hypothetical protein EDD11_009014 [Mortierella claussenii]